MCDLVEPLVKSLEPLFDVVSTVTNMDTFFVLELHVSNGVCLGGFIAATVYDMLFMLAYTLSHHLQVYMPFTVHACCVGFEL